MKSLLVMILATILVAGTSLEAAAKSKGRVWASVTVECSKGNSTQLYTAKYYYRKEVVRTLKTTNVKVQPNISKGSQNVCKW